MNLENKVKKIDNDFENLRRAQDMAERITKSIVNRARKICYASGLDGAMLGIHPHNAMVSLNAGHPWKGINYNLVRQCLWLCNRAYDAHKLVDAYYKRVFIDLN